MRERTWVILLTGDGADPHDSLNDRAKNPPGQFASSPDRRNSAGKQSSRCRHPNCANSKQLGSHWDHA
jgi:hypothetical protein